MTYSREVREWSEHRPWCAVCLAPHWKVERTQVAGLAVHHLIRRSKRRCDEPYNALLLCPRDHEAFHGQCESGWPPLTLGMLLFVKRESGDIWEPAKLEHLYCRKLPTLERLPEKYMAARREHQPFALPESNYYSAAAEEAMLDPRWLPTWHLSQVTAPDGSIWWEVRDGRLYGAKRISKGATDVEAIRAACETNKVG